MDDLIVGLRVLLSLAAVLFLVWWLQRRLSRGRTATVAAPVSVVARQSLGQKASLVVVDVDGSRLTLGVTDQGVTVLQSSAVPAENGADAATLSFSDALSRAATREPASREGGVTPLFRAPVGAAGEAPERVVPLTRAEAKANQRRADASPIAGSILSAHTWRQAAATLRRAGG